MDTSNSCITYRASATVIEVVTTTVDIALHSVDNYTEYCIKMA